MEDYVALSTNIEELEEAERAVVQAFGKEADAERTEGNISGVAFFTNATLEPREAEAIKATQTQQYLYNEVAATAIDKDGIAKEHSLRTMQTVVPCTLYAEILGFPDSLTSILQQSLGMVHHIGMNRNRGLGRCDLIII